MLSAAGPSPPAVPALSPRVLHGLYAWLDGLPLSRPKRHLARDFSDGVMLAEIVKHFRPHLVDLHNYIPACNTEQKLTNWSTLNRKVFPKLGLCVSKADIRNVVANTPGAVEPVLCALKARMERRALGRSPPSEASLQGSGPCGSSANGLWAELTSPLCVTGSSRGPELCVRKTHWSQQPPETGCACDGWDPAGQPWEPPDPKAQHMKEEKEQALAILQETVKILQLKVVQLEQLVKLKDLRIQELADHVEKEAL